jgi:drug/metabolite transporter (DMT)-like permease
MSKDHHILKGTVYGLLAAFFYATLANFVKLSSHVPNESLVFFRNLISLSCFLPIVFSQKVSLKTKFFETHLVRAVISLTGIFLYFYGIKRIALVDAIVLTNTIPLFVPLITLLWKKVVIPLPRFCGIILGFIGVFILMHPSLNRFNAGTIACLGAAICGSFSLLGVRQLSKEDKPRVILFYYFLLLTLFSLVPMIIAWEPFDYALLFFVAIVGISSVAYQYCMTKAITILPTSKASCFIYFSVFFGGVYGFIFWGTLPDMATFFGSLLTIIGGIWTLLEKKPSKKLGQ